MPIIPECSGGNPDDTASAPQPQALSNSGRQQSFAWWSWPALFCAVAVILFLRQPSAILHPSFYAEDGLVFFKQQYENGLATALFTRYAGYLHFAPRIVAALCALFCPVEHIPTAYAVVSLFIAAAITTFFFAPNFRSVIRSDALRAIVVLALTLLPNSDSLMRLAYHCWYLLFFLALLTVSRLPQKIIARCLLFIPAVLAAWSAPLAMVCFPIVLLRIWVAADRGERVWWTALAVATIGYSLTAERTLPMVLDALRQTGWGRSLLHAIGYRVFCYFFLGDTLARPLPQHGWAGAMILSALLAGLCAVGTALSVRKSRSRGEVLWMPAILLYLILASPVLFIMRKQFVPDFLVWGLPTWLFHGRYFFTSTLLLCVLCAVIYEKLFSAWVMAKLWRVGFAAILLIGWMSLQIPGFRLWDWRADRSWKHYARLIRAAEIQALQTGGNETVHVQTKVPDFDFDLSINRATAIRDGARNN